MFSVLFLPLAIYLCKRTMQNKARLELADYEAVGTLLLKFSVWGHRGRLCLPAECCHLMPWDQPLLCVFSQLSEFVEG